MTLAPRVGAKGAMIAAADAIETVAGSDNPGILSGALEILAKVFKDGGMLRRKRGEIVDGFIDASGKAGGGHIVAEDAAIDDLREERGLRNEFADQVRNIFLTFGSEGFLVARSATEGYDDDFAFFGSESGVKQRSGAEERAAKREARGGAEEITAMVGKLTCAFLRSGCREVR